MILELAKEVALSIEGVASVDNRLKVDPASQGGPGKVKDVVRVVDLIKVDLIKVE